MKYSILIEETVSETFEVEADSEEQAQKIAIDKFRNSEFVLDPGNVTQKKVCVLPEDDSKNTEWIEF